MRAGRRQGTPEDRPVEGADKEMVALSTAAIKFDGSEYVRVRDSANKVFNEEFNRYGFWAFSNKQFDEGIAKLSETLPEGFKVADVGAGGFVWAEKAEEIVELSHGGKRAVAARMGDPDFACGAFLYEMDNHEYCINCYQGDYDVCSCFAVKPLEYGDYKGHREYLAEAGYGEDVIRCYEQAKREHMRRAEQNGWI